MMQETHLFLICVLFNFDWSTMLKDVDIIVIDGLMWWIEFFKKSLMYVLFLVGCRLLFPTGSPLLRILLLFLHSAWVGLLGICWMHCCVQNWTGWNGGLLRSRCIFWMWGNMTAKHHKDKTQLCIDLLYQSIAISDDKLLYAVCPFPHWISI